MKCTQADYKKNIFTMKMNKKELEILQYALSCYIDIYESRQPPIERFKQMHNMISDLQGEESVYSEVKKI
jgi:hypothetical protein